MLNSDAGNLFFNLQDTVIMFVASFMLAYALEQSGLNLRIALRFMRLFGGSCRR